VDDAKNNLKQLVDEAMDLVSEWTGKEELDNFQKNLGKLYYAIKEDEKLSDWFADLREYLLDIISRPDSVKNERKQKQAKKLVARGQKLFSTSRYNKEFNKLWASGRDILDNLKNDESSNELKDSISKFLNDFAMNSNGMPDLNAISASMTQLKAFLVPLFRNQLATIPFKRVEILSDDYDVKLEDIEIVGGGLFPERMDVLFRAYNHMELMGKDANDRMHYELELSVDRVKPVFKNVKFWYHKKSFPSITDNGVATITFGGEGISLRAVWTVDIRGSKPANARLAMTKCNIDSMDINVDGEKTKHNILDTLLAPLVSGIIKTRIANGIEDYITSQMEGVNQAVNTFFSIRPMESLTDRANDALQYGFEKMQEIDLNQLQTQGSEVVSKIQEGAKDLVEKINTQLPANAQIPSTQQ